jgi:hypothetical protein
MNQINANEKKMILDYIQISLPMLLLLTDVLAAFSTSYSLSLKSQFPVFPLENSDFPLCASQWPHFSLRKFSIG